MINLSKGNKRMIENFDGEIAVKMQWKTAIDLDLHALITLKDLSQHHVSFKNYGSKTRQPYVLLDQDAGVGDTGGDNEETLAISNLNKIEKVIFYADAYGKDSINWVEKKPELEISYFGKQIKIDFENTAPKGKYFAIASITNGELENLNEVTNHEPSFDGAIKSIVRKGKGLLGKIFG